MIDGRSAMKRRRRDQDRIVGRREGADGQDGRDDRRRDVCAVPHAPGERMPAAAGLAPPPPKAPPASSNPLTALGMTENMRREGHKALCNTAAASNLGQMLNKICIKDGISARQHRAQQGAGRYPAQDRRQVRRRFRRADFHGRPDHALVQPAATIAFDAIGGGRLAGQILTCMENAANKTAKVYQPLRIERAQAVYTTAASIHARSLNRAFGMAGASAAGCYSRS